MSTSPPIRKLWPTLEITSWWSFSYRGEVLAPAYFRVSAYIYCLTEHRYILILDIYQLIDQTLFYQILLYQELLYRECTQRRLIQGRQQILVLRETKVTLKRYLLKLGNRTTQRYRQDVQNEGSDDCSKDAQDEGS